MFKGITAVAQRAYTPTARRSRNLIETDTVHMTVSYTLHNGTIKLHADQLGIHLMHC